MKSEKLVGTTWQKTIFFVDFFGDIGLGRQDDMRCNIEKAETVLGVSWYIWYDTGYDVIRCSMPLYVSIWWKTMFYTVVWRRLIDEKLKVSQVDENGCWFSL